jgi:hypothetical protein
MTISTHALHTDILATVIARYEAIPKLQSRCANPPCNLGIASSYLLAMTFFLMSFPFFQPCLVLTYNDIS